MRTRHQPRHQPLSSQHRHQPSCSPSSGVVPKPDLPKLRSTSMSSSPLATQARCPKSVPLTQAIKLQTTHLTIPTGWQIEKGIAISRMRGMHYGTSIPQAHDLSTSNARRVCTALRMSVRSQAHLVMPLRHVSPSLSQRKVCGGKVGNYRGR